MSTAGPTNSLVDVPGLRVGHRTLDDRGRLTGVTVVSTGPDGAVAGVDVRGGGPGTRETDALDPRNLVDRVHAVVLSGGSALGLGTADGVAGALLADGIGWPIDTGVQSGVVPIVPAAIVFDLGRGGAWDGYPRPEDGAAALRAATDSAVPQGNVGAGTGAKAGPLKGGVGSASVVLPGGGTVAALVVCNAVGSPVDPATGELYAVRSGVALPGEFAVRRPDDADVTAAQSAYAPPTQGPGQATTLAVVATDIRLSKAQCAKFAGVAHDGMARALRPVHSMFDGDTVFGLSTCARETPDAVGLVQLMEAGADCVTRAIAHAVLAAEPVDRSSDGGVALPSWRSLYPSGVGQP
ncbi:P1 family peptidase [Calidifontibacter sp. DB0510]|uniref:P1 family peptidase n=1 Tax=Metallococcus carri TaxID=1656884 RepID=A0A967AYJ5_9MICO|nr:P1 family peptidase [Metallococcus carri]NHN54787.1 P1 family peptidase [Metallococcus carri]NOP37132.1 P1 family peptidase [Calidifontibacter sp. DB2511S]